MSRGITLSLTAVDLLCEQLGLGAAPVIFRGPRVGVSVADRTRARETMLADLTEQDLRYGNEIDRKLSKRLTLLCRAPLAIEATGILRSGRPLRAQVSSNGRSAALAVQEDQSLRLFAVRPTAVVPAVVELIGPARPGPGRSVTYPNPGDERGGEQARRILTQARIQAGVFTVVHRRQREDIQPALLWFDTNAGRYIGYIKPGTHGQNWTTYSPADNTRITQHLTDLTNA
jgi:hypothetical protein